MVDRWLVIHSILRILVEVKLNDLMDLFFLSILGKSTFSTSA